MFWTLTLVVTLISTSSTNLILPQLYFRMFRLPSTRSQTQPRTTAIWTLCTLTRTVRDGWYRLFEDAKPAYCAQSQQYNIKHVPNTIFFSSVSIFVTFSDSSAPLNLNYNLIVNTSLDAPCPNSCSGNGDCLSTGECQCRNDFYGKDCSIHPDNLEITHPASHDIQYKEYYYTKVPSSSLGTKVTITV